MQKYVELLREPMQVKPKVYEQPARRAALHHLMCTVSIITKVLMVWDRHHRPH